MFVGPPNQPQFAHNSQILLVVWLSERFNERLLMSALSNIWMLPFLIGLVVIPTTASPWVRYALLTGVNGIPYSKSNGDDGKNKY